MSLKNCILRHAHIKPFMHSDIWHEGVCANSRFEIAEKAPRPIVGGEFLLLEFNASVKGRKTNGSSIVFISDLHWGGWNLKMYESLAKEISLLEPDYILFGGDLGVFSDDIDDSLKWLSTISSRKGKFAVSGNREANLSWLDVEFWHGARLISDTFATRLPT